MANDVIKHLLDNFESTGWKSVLEFFTVKKPSCQLCKKTFCSENNLKTHIKKYHTNGKNIKCEVCDVTYETENLLRAHNQTNHRKDKMIMCEVCEFTSDDDNELKVHVEKIHTKVMHIKCEICNIAVESSDKLNIHMKNHSMDQDTEVVMQEGQEDAVQKMEVDNNGTHENSEDVDIKVKILEEKIKTMDVEHDIKMKDLIKQLEEKEILYEANKKRMEKEDNRKSNEIKKLKEENVKMAEKLGQLQWNRDKLDAEFKAKEKMAKIKENTELFNRIIANQEMKGKSEMSDNKSCTWKSVMVVSVIT